MMNRRTLIERVRKLRNLASSTTEHEAKAAARAAEKMIQTHRLEQAELLEDDGSVVSDEIAQLGMIPTWVNNLIVTLQQCYQCDGFYERTSRRSVRYVGYGRAEDLEMLKMQFAWFSAEVGRLTAFNAGGRGLRYMNSYRIGVVQGLRMVLLEEQKAAHVKASKPALVRIEARQAEAAAAMREAEPTVRTEKTALPELDMAGFDTGVKHGSRLRAKRHMLGAANVKGTAQ